MYVNYIDLKNFDELEILNISNLVDEYVKKIERDLKDATLILHPKKYKSTGKKIKYSVHVRVEAPNFLFSTEAADWDLARVIHKVLKKVEHQIAHKFKTEGMESAKLRRPQK